MINIEQIARVCHEANRAFCESIGDMSQPSWADAPEWQKSSAINNVRFHLANPNAPASSSHDTWLKDKVENGWKYGPVKNPDAKEHPSITAYEQLSPEEKAKDSLFKSVVDALGQFVVS
jgi:hypothetical protein